MHEHMSHREHSLTLFFSSYYYYFFSSGEGRHALAINVISWRMELGWVRGGLNSKWYSIHYTFMVMGTFNARFAAAFRFGPIGSDLIGRILVTCK